MLYLLFTDLARRSGVQTLWLVKLFLYYLTPHSAVFGRSERPKLSVLLNRFGTCCATNLWFVQR
jgi:hypothetical protein